MTINILILIIVVVTFKGYLLWEENKYLKNRLKEKDIMKDLYKSMY